MTLHYGSLSITRPSDLGSGHWILNGLSDITVLFGRNGIGKSILLRGLRDMNKASYHYASPERSGDIGFNSAYTQEELVFSSRSNRRTQNMALTYREEVIARIPALLQKIGNIRKGKSSPVNPDELEDMIHILLPDFKFVITGANPPYELRRLSNNQSITNVSALSSGEAEIFTLALDLLLICAMWKLEDQSQGLLLIDEPDAHLHPDLQQHLAKFIVELIDKFGVQTIIATHSTTLLTALGYHGGNRTSIVYINNASENQNAVRFDTSLQEIATCLGGHALMGPLFAAPLLLVEGDDDYKIWSQVPRHGNIKIAVIPCNGDEIDRYRSTLERVFASLLPDSTSASGYVLKDGDKTCDNEHFKHVKCLKLACRESENLYLTDEVLSVIGTNWDEVKQKVKSKSSDYGQKAAKLNSIDSWDRLNEDIKDVINELYQIIDPHRLHWAIRLGKVIGAQKPTGQLATYLSADVLATFWPT